MAEINAIPSGSDDGTWCRPAGGTTLTFLEGSTFCICDAIGDMSTRTGGLFAQDTRFLSLFELTIDGERPLLLSAGKVEYFSGAFFMRNPPDRLPQDSLSIGRERFVGEDRMFDRLRIKNVSAARLRTRLALRVASDFADILAVKEHDFALGTPRLATPLPEPTSAVLSRDDPRKLVVEESAGDARTVVHLSQLGEPVDGGVAFSLDLQPKGEWELRLDLLASFGEPPPESAEADYEF